jgi:predicted MFS family arabinose efflux permease
MFIAEAIPTVLLGLGALLYFPDTPAEARFLSDGEKQWLATHAAHRQDRNRRNDWSGLREPLVPMAGLLWFCLLSGSYGVIYWLPQVIQSMTGLSSLGIGLVGALPWIGVVFGMYFNARHSDRTGERYWHVALPALLAAAMLLVAWQAGAGMLALVALLLAGLGLGSAQGAFWAVPTPLLKPASFSVAVVAINILGSAGGLVMPQVMGIARERSGGFAVPTLLVVGVLVIAALLVAAIHLRYRRDPRDRPAAAALRQS